MMIIRTIIIIAILAFTLSNCGNAIDAGAPKSKVVVVDKPSPAEKGPKGGDESAMNDSQVNKAKQIIASVSEKAIAAVDPKKIFKANCASCHGFTGNLGVNGAKDLTKSIVSLEEAVAQVYHGRGLMTPYKDVLEPAELVAVAKYTETLRK